ncbi:hypothetical protein [Salmonirosea aquatica]|uniref:Curlin n=1 Tax=Salmonirosea aquatica TaxID=2654236 RepID=A0A7C9BHP3_9BACT|nr:hypothetical protein [Cytophagaceae bacterium SJW1-29]
MKKLLAFAGTVLLLNSAAHAQQLSGSSELTLLNQSGLSIKQVLASASSVSLDELTSYQRGNANQQTINPQQGENQIQMIQDGSFNTMDVQLLGERNNFQFVQQGNRNVLELRNVQANDNTLQIIQRGNNNQLIDQGSGLLSRPIRIEQSGGMKVFINGQ